MMPLFIIIIIIVIYIFIHLFICIVTYHYFMIGMCSDSMDKGQRWRYRYGMIWRDIHIKAEKKLCSNNDSTVQKPPTPHLQALGFDSPGGHQCVHC